MRFKSLSACRDAGPGPGGWAGCRRRSGIRRPGRRGPSLPIPGPLQGAQPAVWAHRWGHARAECSPAISLVYSTFGNSRASLELDAPPLLRFAPRLVSYLHSSFTNVTAESRKSFLGISAKVRGSCGKLRATWPSRYRPPRPRAHYSQTRLRFPFLLRPPPPPLPPPPPPPPPHLASLSPTRGAAAAAAGAPPAHAAGHVGGDGAELHRVLRRLGPRLRGHRAHAHPPPPGLRVLVLVLLRLPRPRPQARLLRRRRRPLLPARRRVLRCSPGTQGAGGGVAAGEVVPQERARRRRGLQQGQAGRQVRQGGRRRRALPAEGGPRGLRRLRPAPPRAPGQVLLPFHHPEVRRRREEAGGRSERDGVRAHVRGQGRRLDARRRRPLEDVCGNLPAPSSDEKFRGCQLSTNNCPMKHTHARFARTS